MPTFRYEAIDPRGNIVMGAMDAMNPADVDRRLSGMGYRTERVMPAPTTNSSGAAKASTGSAIIARTTSGAADVNDGFAKPRQMAVFFRQLSVQLRSGIAIYQALESLAPRTEPSALREAAGKMATAARTGGRVSDVMEQYPRLFAPHMVGGVRAGEMGGFLELVMDEIAQESEDTMAFYKGAWLPISLVTSQILAVALSQPMFPSLFPEANFPKFAALALLRNLPIALGILGLIWFGWKRLHYPENRERLDTFTLKMPLFGKLARQRSLFCFLRMLKRLYAAGLGPIHSWQGSMAVVPNAVIRHKLEHAFERVQRGTPLHDAFTDTGLFAGETEQLLATGVVTGQVVQMLDRVCDYYQLEMDSAVSRARLYMMSLGTSLFLALIGFSVIWAAHSYFNGIFSWVDSFMGSDK